VFEYLRSELEEEAAALMASPEQWIIIVEDDAAVRKAIERLLRAACFPSVQSFPSAEALLETNAGEGAACLVFDIHLPGISGLDLRRRLTASGHQPPVIFITAHDEPTLRAEAELLGCVGYFRKPFEGSELLQVIRRALAS
jgi:FixJ family two-component response regulator